MRLWEFRGRSRGPHGTLTSSATHATRCTSVQPCSRIRENSEGPMRIREFEGRSRGYTGARNLRLAELDFLFVHGSARNFLLMRTDRFDYDLPPSMIAQHPLPDRDESRLLVLQRSRRDWQDSKIAALPELLQSGDLLVFNDTRVIPARLRATREATGGKVEVFLLPPEPGVHDEEAGEAGKASPVIRRVLTRSGGHLQPGETLTLAGGVKATLLERKGLAGDMLAIELDANAFRAYVEQQGEIPLPPYIQRSEGPSSESDRNRYQTIFAARDGAVAAPTAGLHFTPSLLTQLEERGVEQCRLTLHVGLGTFRTVKAEQVEDHYVDPEPFEIGAATAKAVTRAKAEGRRVLPVGTTALRTLESCWDADAGALKAGVGYADIFIRPPFTFRVADGLLTNFHLPKSSLLMLAAALAAPEKLDGIDWVLKAYEHAKENGYRFFSYGDACLFL